MCGIAGIFGNKANQQNINLMLDKINHRGPDSKGFTIFNNFAIGSTRLSIIDLSNKGKMPLIDVSGQFEIVFNGEIYNYIELKNQFDLKTISNTDTEILLELFKLKGEKCLDYLNGIFAFAILDKKNESLFCARDRFGIKPFYYTRYENNFIFSSEIKPIISISKNYQYNEKYIINYLSTGKYNFDKNTFFKNIYELEPSHLISISNKKFNIKRYWTLNKQNYDYNENQYEDLFLEKMENAFKMQMVSDTNIGLNVSSGIDSISMLLMVNKINNGQKNISANSYYFDEPLVDEKQELENFSKKIKWDINFQKITPDDIINNIEEMVYCNEQPFPGVITFAKNILIKNNYEKDRKVILEAQGGDDIGCGYKHCFPFFILDKIKDFSFHKAYTESQKFMNNEELSISEFTKFFFNSLNYYKGKVSADGSSQFKINSTIKFNNDQNIFFKDTDSMTSLDKLVYTDLFSSKLPRILKSCDMNSMTNGKELRVPLLDHTLVEFIFSIPNNYKISNGNLRNFYRCSIKKYIKKNYSYLNNELSTIFRKKNYISDPQTLWFKNKLYDWINDILSKKDCFYHNFLDPKIIIKNLDEFKKNKKINNSFLFWQILNLEFWGKKFF